MMIKLFEGNSAESVQRRANGWMHTHHNPVEEMRLTMVPRGPLGLLGTRYCIMLVVAGVEDGEKGALSCAVVD